MVLRHNHHFQDSKGVLWVQGSSLARPGAMTGMASRALTLSVTFVFGTAETVSLQATGTNGRRVTPADAVAVSLRCPAGHTTRCGSV